MSGGRMKVDLIGPIGADPPVDMFSTVKEASEMLASQYQLF